MGTVLMNHVKHVNGQEKHLAAHYSCKSRRTRFYHQYPGSTTLNMALLYLPAFGLKLQPFHWRIWHVRYTSNLHTQCHSRLDFWNCSWLVGCNCRCMCTFNRCCASCVLGMSLKTHTYKMSCAVHITFQYLTHKGEFPGSDSNQTCIKDIQQTKLF